MRILILTYMHLNNQDAKVQISIWDVNSIYHQPKKVVQKSFD